MPEISRSSLVGVYGNLENMNCECCGWCGDILLYDNNLRIIDESLIILLEIAHSDPITDKDTRPLNPPLPPVGLQQC